MSTPLQQQQEGQLRIECDHPDCGREGRPWEFQEGYCSERHRYQDRGRQALAELKYSHTRCFSCLAELKEIEPPKPEEAFDVSGVGLTYNPEADRVETTRFSQYHSQQAAVGFQHLTPSADIGEKDVTPSKVATGTICGECGATDHTTHIPLLADGERTAALVVEFLERDNSNVDDVDGETLTDVYGETGDLELATGKAVQL